MIAALLEAYRAAVNFYIKSLWKTPGKLDAATNARLPANKTRLSARYKSAALKQALEIVVATKRAARATGRYASCPAFRGPATLDAKFIDVEQGRGTFDLIIRLSTLHKGKRISIPTKKTAPLNKWLSKPGARLKNGGLLSENGLIVWIDLPDLPTKSGIRLGADIGVNKLISTSDGKHYGQEFKKIRDKILRKKQGSKAKRRALRERDNFVNRTINELPWASLGFLAIENLKNVKKGKSPKRSKKFRKALVPWAYRQVIEGLKNKAQENRVHLVAVDPAYTSQTCPSCGLVHRDNRKAEDFQCLQCGFTHDADTVGALNILAKAL